MSHAHPWIRHVPTAVLEELVNWWDNDLVVVRGDLDELADVDGHTGDFHPQPCDGSSHATDWTGAVCAELTARRSIEEERASDE